MEELGLGETFECDLCIGGNWIHKIEWNHLMKNKEWEEKT